MPDRPNQYYVGEIRFTSRAIFHDIYGRIVEAVEEVTGLPDWVLQQGSQVIIHDGGPQGELNTATRQVVVAQSRLAYVVVNPQSVNQFLNDFKSISDKVYSLFNKNLDYQRVGARSVRYLPVSASFSELRRDFLSKYGKPEITTLFPRAEFDDIGFSVDYNWGKAKLHTACGPMMKEQAVNIHFQAFAQSPNIYAWSDAGIFFDMDFYQNDDLPTKLTDIRVLFKKFFDEQEEAAERIKSQLGTETVAA